MAKSIIQQSQGCFFCGRQGYTEVHHIFFGNPWRTISENNGFTVRLCPECHRVRSTAPHNNRQNDLLLKRMAQREYEKTHSREEFMKLIGRSYLDDNDE